MSDVFASLSPERREGEPTEYPFSTRHELYPHVVGLQTVEAHAVGSEISDARGNDRTPLLRLNNREHSLRSVNLALYPRGEASLIAQCRDGIKQPRSFFEGDAQISAQPVDKLSKWCSLWSR